MVKRYTDGTPYAIEIAGIEWESIVDGPGIRTAIFMQGCNHNCEGCHNPETHSFGSGYYESIKYILDIFSSYYINNNGITISGGDPFDPLNIAGTIELCKEFKERFPTKSIWVYTGYKYEHIKDVINYNNMENYIDVLVDGEYIKDLRTLDIPFVGSSNQRIIDLNKTVDKDEVVLYE